MNSSDLLASDFAMNGDLQAVATVTESPPASGFSFPKPTDLVRPAFVRMQAEFELENDLSLVYPMTEKIQQMVSWAYGDYNDSYCFQLAISLEEALTNAIIHGNLEISSTLRADAEAIYEGLIKQRPLEMPFSQRRAKVRVALDREQLSLVIRDQGPGFQVSEIPDPTAPENLEKVCGRGLALMRNFMDAVFHNPQGNMVTMIKCAPTKLVGEGI